MSAAAPGGLDATSAARFMLGRQSSDIASDNARTINTDFDIAARKAGAAAFARTLSVGGLLPLYSLPPSGPVTADSLRPTGYYVVLVNQGNSLISTFLMKLDMQAHVWKYSPDPMTLSPGNYEAAVEGLKTAAGRDSAGARFVWFASPLSWWVVRRHDGDQVVPIMSEGGVRVAGQRLDLKLYPASTVRETITRP